MRDGWWLLLGAAVVWWLLSGRQTKPKGVVDEASSPDSDKVKIAETRDAAIARGRTAYCRQPQPIRSPHVAAPARWIAPGDVIDVRGLCLPYGMIYVRAVSRLASYQPNRHEAHVIDPEAPIAPRHMVADDDMSYWPSYSGATPAARNAYLAWLAGGRRDPVVNIGCVFLFLYGLEHRLLVESAWQDAPAIVAEVEALLAIHHDHASFRWYACSLLDAVSVATGNVRDAPRLELRARSGKELPNSVRYSIGRRLVQGRLSGDWLLGWYLAHPETVLRTPATRCFDEFCQLFQHRFAAQYPNGLNVRIPAKKLRLTYSLASGARSIPIPGDYTSWPDPISLTAPLKVAAAIASDCSTALDPYSRLLGRDSTAKGSLAAQMLLPAGLESRASETLTGLQQKLNALAPTGVWETTVGEVLTVTQLAAAEQKKPSASMLQTLSLGLASLGFGMEPDPRFGGTITAASTPILLFRAKEGAAIDAERPAYAAARILVEIGAIAATIEAANARAGLNAVQAEIAHLAHLTGTERLRLQAYLATVRRSLPNPKSAFQKLAAYAEPQRRQIARVAIGALAADRRVGVDEVRFAERLYKTLGLPSEQLYADLHGASGTAKLGDDALPTVLAAETATGGVAIHKPAASGSADRAETQQQPPCKSKNVEPRTIDPARLEERRKATQTVADLLKRSSDAQPDLIQAIELEPARLERQQQPSTTSEATAPAIIIDIRALAQKRQETQHVHLLLRDVFAEDAHVDPDPISFMSATRTNESLAAQQSKFTGLDSEHATLVELLVIHRGSLSRSHFEAAVSQQGLFVDGALETINEWAYGRFNEPLVDDGDTLIIPGHLLPQLEEAA